MRAVEQRNGYEGWRLLITEMQPSSRQRQLALASQLANVKFDAKLSLAEQLTKYEEVIREYERVSGSRYNYLGPGVPRPASSPDPHVPHF